MTLKLPIYMDNHATTPVDPRVLEAMMPFFTSHFGNAASRNHAFGWAAEEAVEYARDQVAKLIGAGSSKEIVFTSGATESDNLAIKGVAHFYKEKGDHIITSRTEHKAVLDTCKRLEREGFRVTYLDVDQKGQVSPDDVKKALTDKTILVSIMLCNNEIGTVQPIAEIGKLTRERGILFHTDAVQGAGRMEFDVEKMNVDLASLSAHKMYGPKGVGALYVRRSKPRVRIVAEMDGGGHERGMRSGTLNVPGIVGMGKASEILVKEYEKDRAHSFGLRERLRKKLFDNIEQIHLNGADDPWRHPGNLNVSFSFVEGEAMLMAIKDVAVSSGSACTSASLEPSYVLRALGVDEELAHSSIRFGLGRFNTEEEVDYVADLVIRQVKRLREMSPLYEMWKDGVDLKTIQWTAH
ncbi:IscS subfamily cysteine desulfurase [Sandaracinus amylolyticus]|uniref:Cysteine desulfurase IscS n=1 Tax=Sandaracinus amylolyticus TaxID=927083 RepID=A0A0F6W4W3_9BACT|nr:IscS subfamily cysteine desulfurase [Sandaracinus amylolyticus]AKF07562.1 Cysteine desulfurase [Sandaracinus amylolyticus]